MGFLDVWAAADGEYVAERLSSALVDGGPGWRPHGLLDQSDGDVEAAGITTLLADLFDKARERAECLSAKRARATYSEKVLDPGLRKVTAAVRTRWNALNDPLRSGAREAALFIETLEELCRFMDKYSLAGHLVSAVDEANTLRLGALAKIADLLESLVQEMMGRLSYEASIFSYELDESFAVLRKRLRSTNFKTVMQRTVGTIGERLANVLLRQTAFADDAELEVFVSNCRDDLATVLQQGAGLDVTEDCAPLRRLWDGCALLVLSPTEAADAFSAFKKIRRCAPAGLVKEPWQKAVRATAESAVGVSEVLLSQLRAVMEGAGIEELSVDEASIVLGKRPDLASEAAEEMLSASADALQELMSGTAHDALQLGSGALQLGSGALQKLGAPPAPRAAAAQGGALLQTASKGVASGVAELRCLLPGRLGR